MATDQKKSDQGDITLTKQDLERMLKYLERTKSDSIVIKRDDVDIEKTAVMGPYCSDVC